MKKPWRMLITPKNMNSKKYGLHYEKQLGVANNELDYSHLTLFIVIADPDYSNHMRFYNDHIAE